MHQQRKLEEEESIVRKGDKQDKFWELFHSLDYHVDLKGIVSNSLLRNAKGNNLYSLFRSLEREAK